MEPIVTHLTPQQLAQRLGMNPYSLANWRVKGVGPKYIKINQRKVLYALEDVAEWEMSLKKQSTTQRSS
jgi:hypothetical protein